MEENPVKESTELLSLIITSRNGYQLLIPWRRENEGTFDSAKIYSGGVLVNTYLNFDISQSNEERR